MTMRQLALVMLYGPKSADFEDLIVQCQNKSAQVLGKRFEPYDVQQVHATLISLERAPGTAFHNLSFLEHRDQLLEMDFEGLLGFLRNGQQFPYSVQIGGFQNQDYSFTSKGRNPYERSCSVAGDKAMLFGWPVKVETETNLVNADLSQAKLSYPTTLEDIRSAAQSYNILHRYHVRPKDVDNDFYFRLGMIDAARVDLNTYQSLTQSLRVFLSEMSPLFLKITLSDVYIVSYEENTLPLSTTRAWSISDRRVTPDLIAQLYD